MQLERWALLFAGLLIAGSAIAPEAAADGKKSWTEIKKAFAVKYSSSDWNTKVEGVKLLAEADSKKACDMLAGLVRRHDAEIAKVLKELASLKDKTKPYLGRTTFTTGELEHFNALKEEIKQKEVVWGGHERICEACSWALGQMRSEEAQKWLLKAVTKKPWRMQVVVARALGRLGGPHATKSLLKGLKQRNPRVVAACLDGLAMANAASASPQIQKELSSKYWQVRAAAARALGTLGAVDAIPALIDQMVKEDGRLQTDLNEALIKLTGVDYQDNAQLWRAWYNANKEKVLARAGKPLADGEVRRISDKQEPGSTEITFYGIKTRSQAIVFVIDRSGSMEEMSSGRKGEDAEPKKKKPVVTLTGEGKGDEIRKIADEAVAEIKGGRKIDVAKRELIKAISALSPKARFTIIWYNEAVQPWQQKLVAADHETKKAVIEEIKKLEPLGATNIFDSLEQAFKLAGFGKAEENYLGGADTIFLLSDGAPNHGRFTAWSDIHREVEKLNKDRGLTIHTIGIGQAHNAGDMRQLAEENKGKYTARN